MKKKLIKNKRNKMENNLAAEINKSIKLGVTKFTNDFSEEIYEQTYKFGQIDDNINGTHFRVAENLASVGEDKDFWTQKFIYAQEDFKFVPGGRITSNAGTSLKGTTYINCFVSGFEGKHQDSMEGILSELRRQALILKSEGGYGFCSDVMRPRGTFIGGIGNESPGAVKMLDMWDTQSDVITAGSGEKTKNKNGKIKIRKGAQMVTMSCWHPDIEEFITAKQTSGRLTKFNMSVLMTDEFMKAVELKQPWILEFPNIESHKEEYDDEWDGNIKLWKEKGYDTVVYKTYEDANELWEVIMESTYNRNEPGVLFVDTINKMNNLWYNENISATNPCGEQLLPIGGVCLLGSLNLTQFVDVDNKDWDYEKIKEIVPIAVRMMDNVNDLTYVPLDVQAKNLKNKRRIGLGIMGYGSALMMMRLKYGSDKSLELTRKLMEFISNTAYQASALIAKEKGSFLLYDEEKYLSGNFVKQLSDETKSLIKQYGIRNSHLLSIQPTGNSSVFANNVSGGLEPIFMPEYIRTTMMPYPPEGLSVPKNINWNNKTFDVDGDSDWEWTKEGDENLLRTEFNDHTWKFDKSRGLLRETVVKDYAVRFLEDRNQWNPEARWVATTTELTIDEHVDTMSVFAKYIDSAISKTTNIPNDYPYSDFKKIYMDAYKTGTIKGFTTYRAGTMTTVLSSTDKTDGDGRLTTITKTRAPKRPKSLECEINHLTVRGKKWIVIVGLLDGEPYEVFAFKKKNLQLPTKWKSGLLTKVKKGYYNLEVPDEEFVLENVSEHFERDEEEALTRMISGSLRHGMDIKFVVEQLSKSEGTIVSFSKAIVRTLNKYLKEALEVDDKKCPSCNDPEGIVYQEGCLMCKSCGFSKCGS
jgi:ribonucleoside-diphosphate reductase alpha chain